MLTGVGRAPLPRASAPPRVRLAGHLKDGPGTNAPWRRLDEPLPQHAGIALVVPRPLARPFVESIEAGALGRAVDRHADRNPSGAILVVGNDAQCGANVLNRRIWIGAAFMLGSVELEDAAGFRPRKLEPLDRGSEIDGIVGIEHQVAGGPWIVHVLAVPTARPSQRMDDRLRRGVGSD